MLQVHAITKSYGARLVLSDITFSLQRGQRLGLVGANGSGKSTLLKIIAGEIEADAGRVQLGSGIALGYLPQVVATFTGQTVAALIDHALAQTRQLETELRLLEGQMASATGDTLTAILDQYGSVQEQFETRGGYDLDHRLDAILGGMQLHDLDRAQLAGTLSGGEKARLALALLLLQTPDLLLLDEPTNHLDFAALTWLETYLATYPGAALVVSHDRQFLNRAVTAILDIDEHKHTAKQYAGGYDVYSQAKVAERAQWETDYVHQADELRELRQALKGKARQVSHNRPPPDNDKFAKHFFREQVEGAISRNVRSIEEKLHRIEADPIPRPPEPLRFHAALASDKGVARHPLIASNLFKRYDDQPILNGVDLTLGATDRVVIVAPNGAGKSTLLRILAGAETPDSGEVFRARSARFGYLDQEGESLPKSGTVMEVYSAGRDEPHEALKAELLRFGLFRYDEINEAVTGLSTGQRRKLQLALLIASRPNVLLLDEPTNHVSFDVVEGFEAALADFPGAILAISHDRRFIERFTGEMGGTLWQLETGRLRQALGQEVDTASILEE